METLRVRSDNTTGLVNVGQGVGCEVTPAGSLLERPTLYLLSLREKSPKQ